MDLSTYWSDRLTTRTLVKLPLPSGFDLWLSENYFTPHKDYLPDAQFQWGDIPSNDVLCTVQMSMITLHEDDFFTDIKAYSLMMYCDVPESSGIDISHLSSPIVTLGHYEGLAGDEDAPIWCRRIDPGYVFEFKQPRLGMAELFFKFGKSTKNYTLKNAILNWATALHWSAIDHCKKRKLQYISDSDTEDSDCSKLAERPRRSSTARRTPARFMDSS